MKWILDLLIDKEQENKEDYGIPLYVEEEYYNQENNLEEKEEKRVIIIDL